MHYAFMHSLGMDGPTLFGLLLTKRGHNPTSLAKAIRKPTAQAGFDRFRKGEIRQPRRSPALEAAAKLLGVDVLAFYDSGLAEREWARIEGGAETAHGSVSELAVPSTLLGVRPLLLRLAKYLEPMDAADRKAAKAILEALADEPEEGARWASKMERLLGETPQSPEGVNLVTAAK